MNKFDLVDAFKMVSLKRISVFFFFRYKMARYFLSYIMFWMSVKS